MTNSFNDIRNSKTMLVMVATGRRTRSHCSICSTPRITAPTVVSRYARGGARDRLCPHAAWYRHPADLWDAWHIFRMGWEDKQFNSQRVWDGRDRKGGRELDLKRSNK